MNLILSIALILLGVTIGWRIGRRTRTQPGPWSDQHELDAALVAAAEERKKIYRNIHDDIGGKLLTLLHTSADNQQADLVRTIMQDLRDVVSRTSDASGSLVEVLAQIRDETEQRLECLNGSLKWDVDTELPSPQLNDAQALHLFRISREAVTNAIRHAHAKQLRIRMRCSKDVLIMDFTDDGDTFTQPGDNGTGTGSMRHRAESLHGSIDWVPGTEGGTKVVLEFPLPTP